MSLSTVLVVCMAVAALGGVLIIIALIMGRSRRNAAAALFDATDSIEDLTPEVTLDLDPDIQHPRPISHVPAPTIPSSFGPRPFDDADTQRQNRVARGTTSPPPIPAPGARTLRRTTSAPPRAADDAKRKPTAQSS